MNLGGFRREAETIDEKPKSQWKMFFSSFFRGWVWQVLIWLVTPVMAVNFWLFRWDDFKNNCHVKIHPSFTEWNNLQIKKGIKLLKEKTPRDYQEFCRNVKSISPELACGGFGGGCYNNKYPTEITVSTSFRLKENHTEVTGAIIAHEVCHLLQGKEGRQFQEEECYDDYCRVLGEMGVRKDYDSRC